MTRLGYLLPFLCALGWGANAQTTIPFTTVPTTSTSQVATTVNKVSTSVNPSGPIVPSSKAATLAADSPTTTATKTMTATTINVSPPLSAVAIKPTTIVASTQGAIQPTTVKTDTKTVEVTSSGPMLSTIKDNALSSTSPNDNSAQPTNPAKVSTTILNHSVVAVTSQPNLTEYTTKPETKLTTTSLSITRTSEQSIGKVATNNMSTVSWPSTVSPSLVTVPKSTAGSISDSAKGLGKETKPTTIPLGDYDIDNITVSCKAEHERSKVKFNINPSRNCVEYATIYKEDAKEILKHICTAVKPGYQPKTDKCHVDLGSQSLDHLVILNAYVQNSPSADALYASLKHLKKDGSDLFQYDAKKYEEEDLISIPLISGIVSVAVALLIASAIYGCCHQRQARKREQRLTEELQTMENGYHDNPTLEVMETSPEMQEKKGGPNGELGDSWIVPLDNLTREDFDEEEDTHL